MQLVILFLLAVAGCGRASPVQTTEFSGNAMTIDYRVVVGSALSQEQQKQVAHVIEESFQQIDAIYNKWNPKSELSQLNQLTSNTPQKLSPSLHEFLKFTGTIVALSDGRFDPTVETVQGIWKKHLEKGIMPPEKELQRLKEAAGWGKIHYEDGIFIKDHDETKLDLGGIAKGYAVDLIVENLGKEGYKNLYVEWGGEIRTLGKHPQNRPWKVFISRLEDTDPSHAIAIVELADEAMATSGDYLQKWQVQDVEYFHVINPLTMAPLVITKESIGSASVTAKTCAFADGLATAAVTFPDKKTASMWLESISMKYPEVRYWLLDRIPATDEKAEDKR